MNTDSDLDSSEMLKRFVSGKMEYKVSIVYVDSRHATSDHQIITFSAIPRENDVFDVCPPLDYGEEYAARPTEWMHSSDLAIENKKGKHEVAVCFSNLLIMEHIERFYSVAAASKHWTNVALNNNENWICLPLLRAQLLNPVSANKLKIVCFSGTIVLHFNSKIGSCFGKLENIADLDFVDLESDFIGAGKFMAALYSAANERIHRIENKKYVNLSMPRYYGDGIRVLIKEPRVFSSKESMEQWKSDSSYWLLRRYCCILDEKFFKSSYFVS